MKDRTFLLIAILCFIASGALAAQGFLIGSMLMAVIGGGVLIIKDRKVELDNAENAMQALAIMFHAYRRKYEANGGPREIDVLIKTLAADISGVGNIVNDQKAMIHTSHHIAEAFKAARKQENLTC